MSFQNDKPDTATIRLIVMIGLIIAITLVMINEGRKFQRSGTTAEATKE